MTKKEETKSRGVKRKVLVTGATGFLGQYLVRALAESGNYSLVCFSRRKAEVLESLPGVRQFQGDVRNLKDLEEAVKGAEAVIHLAASVSSKDVRANYDINVLGAKNMVEACRKQGVKRIIFTSTVSAVAEERCNYGFTKSQAEEVFFASGLDWTVFRLSFVYGWGGKGFTKIKDSIARFPFFIPLVGRGDYLRQPVYVGDVVQMILKVLEIGGERFREKVYTLGGPEAVPFKKIVEVMAVQMNVRKKIIPLPLPVCRLAASLLEKTMASPPLVVRDVISIAQDTPADISAAMKELSFNPVSLEEGMKRVFSGKGVLQD